MVLRFEVNQAEAFRQGVNVQKSTNHIDVKPEELPQEVRNLIADRLDGIDVCELDDEGKRLYLENPQADGFREVPNRIPKRIIAKLPTFEALMEAIRANEKQINR